ncbi:hypothetical protein ACA910_005460 [Epithemia clementina (nom. ined.)]
MLPDVAPLTHGDRHIIGEEAVEQELIDEWENPIDSLEAPLMSSLVASQNARSDKLNFAWRVAETWKSHPSATKRFVLWLNGNALYDSYVQHFCHVPQGPITADNNQSIVAAAANNLFHALMNVPVERCRCITVIYDSPSLNTMRDEFFPVTWWVQQGILRRSVAGILLVTSHMIDSGDQGVITQRVLHPVRRLRKSWWKMRPMPNLPLYS